MSDKPITGPYEFGDKPPTHLMGWLPEPPGNPPKNPQQNVPPPKPEDKPPATKKQQ